MTTQPFDEVEAATKLGFPGEKFESIQPYLIDGLYWVVIGQEKKKIARPVIVANGHVVAEKGYAVGMAWLRQLAALDKPVNTSVVPQVLRWYEALPLGWGEQHVADSATGGVTLRPLEVKLESRAYIRPWSRSASPPPPVGPLGPPPGGPAGKPTGGPPGAPGGIAPPRPSRATLREVDGKLTWILEAIDPATNQWREELRERAED